MSEFFHLIMARFFRKERGRKWKRASQTQADAAGVAFFFKQWGS